MDLIKQYKQFIPVLALSVRKAEIQRCIVHQIRSSLKFVSWKDRKAVAKDLKTIYSAATEEDAQLALTEFNDIWGSKYPHILQSWLNNWK